MVGWEISFHATLKKAFKKENESYDSLRAIFSPFYSRSSLLPKIWLPSLGMTHSLKSSTTEDPSVPSWYHTEEAIEGASSDSEATSAPKIDRHAIWYSLSAMARPQRDWSIGLSKTRTELAVVLMDTSKSKGEGTQRVLRSWGWLQKLFLSDPEQIYELWINTYKK